MILDGYICSNCYKKIPYVLHNNIAGYSDITLSYVIDYCKKLYDQFEETAHYGDLLIDEFHGLLAFKKKENIAVFDVLDIEDIGLYCTNACANQYNKVTCDVEVNCILSHPSIKIKHIIKKKISCKSKKISENKIEWEEPGDLSMFRSMIEQMYITKIKKHSSNYKEYLKTYNSIELLKAKALFMIDEESTYDADYLKRQRNILIKNFHPDESHFSNEESTRYTQIINNAYHLLMENAVKG